MRPTNPDPNSNPGFERVRFALRSEGVKPDTPNPLRSGVHSRGYLPHVKCEGVSYFVTFRLADSLPKEVLMKFQAEHAERLRRLHILLEARKKNPSMPLPLDTEEIIDRDYYRQVERYLDKGMGACYLNRPEITELVANAIRHFEGERYRLLEWVVMPNHAHVVLCPMPNELLGEIVKSWKGFTGRKANALLNRAGQPFWQREAFDHWIRDDAEKARICRYVRNNPVIAGLCKAPEEWRWSSAWRGGSLS